MTGSTEKGKGREGKVLKIDTKKGKVLVEGINIVKRHSKPSAQNQTGGIIEKEAPIDISNVMLVHKGEPTRIGFKVVDGKKVRVAKSNGDVID
jgi:large subunit ribosomal protein L24